MAKPSRVGIDEALIFYPLHIAVLTIADTRSRENDCSGDLLIERASAAGHRIIGRGLVEDDVEAIRAQVLEWVGQPEIEVILTTGGTGFGPRDVTPEALKPLFRREMDGFSVLMHHASMSTVGVSTLQSRACAGQIGDTFVFCLPGSPGACRDAWELILVQEFDSRHRPCSLAGVIPRLRGVCR